MTSQGGLQMFLNEWKKNIYHDNQNKTNKDIIIKLALYICITRLWLHLSYSIDQRLKVSAMVVATILVYSSSGITSGKTVFRNLKMAAILKMSKY